MECAGRISLEIQQLSTPREVGMTPETKRFPFFSIIYKTETKHNESAKRVSDGVTILVAQ